MIEHEIENHVMFGEWYVEQYIKLTRLWVYVKGSTGPIEWASRVQKNLEAHGVRARLRMKGFTF